MTVNTTTRFPHTSPRTTLSATHQYQTGYPDEMRVIIWTWWFRVAITASAACAAAADRTMVDSRAETPSVDPGPADLGFFCAAGGPRWSIPDLTMMTRTGAARRKSGTLGRVQ